MSVKNDMQVLNQKKLDLAKLKKQQIELNDLPKSITVKYVGEKNMFSHKGRSKLAGRNPYRFNKWNEDTKEGALVITEPEDIKFFLNSKSENFETSKGGEIPDEYEALLAEFEEDEVEEDDVDESLETELVSQKAAVAKIEKELKAKAKKAADAKSKSDDLKKNKITEAKKAKKLVNAKKKKAIAKKKGDEK